MPFSPPRKPLGELSLDPGQRGSGLSLLAAVLPKLVTLSFKTSIIFFYAPGHECACVHTHTCAHPDTHTCAHADTHTHVNAHTRARAHTPDKPERRRSRFRTNFPKLVDGGELVYPDMVTSFCPRSTQPLLALHPEEHPGGSRPENAALGGEICPLFYLLICSGFVFQTGLVFV